MKLKSTIFQIILISFIIQRSYCFSQIIPDFTIETKGGISGMSLDNSKNIHLVAGASDSNGIHVNYIAYDSTGKLLIPEKNISSYSHSGANIHIVGKYAFIAYVLYTHSFNSYVDGQVLDLSSEDWKINEIQLNDIFFDAYRSSPKISHLNDSVFIVAWHGGGPEAESGIFAQLVSNNGQKIGKNIFVSDNTGSGIQCYVSRVLGFPSGNGFVVIWRDNHTNRDLIYGRILNSSGESVGASFPIAEDDGNTQIFYSDAAIDSSGNFAVVWGEERDSIWEIKMRWFTEAANPIGNSITVSDNLVSEYSESSISIDKDGKGIVFWEKYYPYKTKIYGRRFSSDKELMGDEFKLSSDLDVTKEFKPMTTISGNDIITAWRTSKYIYSDGQEDNSITEYKINIIDYFLPPNLQDTITHVENSPNNLGSFYLFQNYPNPFNPSTIINYQIPHDGIVTIKVFDIIGNEITTLVNEPKSAGIYQAQFNAQNLASGIYIYTIKVSSPKGGYLTSKKMTLIK